VGIGPRLRVRHLVADVAAVKRRLIRMLVEEIRRDADEAVAREALGEVARVPHQAIALMHEHDGGHFGVRRRNGEEGGEPACAMYGSGGDIGHRGQSTMLGLRRLRSQSITFTSPTSVS